MMMLSGQNVFVAMLAATLSGMLTGLVTGIFHTFMGIPAILAGILTQLSLYSINLKIMGKANQAINVETFAPAVFPAMATDPKEFTEDWISTLEMENSDP